MRLLTIIAAALSLVFTTAAEAKHRHQHHQHVAKMQQWGVVSCDDRFGCGGNRKAAYAPVERFRYAPSQDGEQIVAHPPGCPHTAYCGCGTSWRVYGRLVRDLYLAANWYRFPRAHPAPGMVAIFGRHHVAYIEAVDGNGNATLYDPNSGGHKTRVHVRNISGATVVNPNG